MFEISREYSFSAAHRLEGHPKCGRLHGHNYKVIVYVLGQLYPTGMVMDYGDLDKVVKPIIELIDHLYIVSEQNIRLEDPYYPIAGANGHVYLLQMPTSTAECIAHSLWKQICDRVDARFKIVVEVQETEKSSARFPARFPDPR